MITIKTKRGLINIALSGLLAVGIAGCQLVESKSPVKPIATATNSAAPAMPSHPFLTESTYRIYHANMAMSALQPQAARFSSVSRSLSEKEIPHAELESFKFVFPTF